MPSALLDPITQQQKDAKACSPADIRPCPLSHDSGEEFSFARLLHVQELIQSEDEILDRRVFDDDFLHVA
jgi:hypothetical protein